VCHPSDVRAAAVRACCNDGDNLMLSVNVTTIKHCRIRTTAVYATSTVVQSHHSRTISQQLSEHSEARQIPVVLKLTVNAQSAYSCTSVLKCGCVGVASLSLQSVYHTRKRSFPPFFFFSFTPLRIQRFSKPFGSGEHKVWRLHIMDEFHAWPSG